MTGGASPGREGRWWAWQAATGLLLVLFLGVHWVAQHYLAPGGLRTYDQVVAWAFPPPTYDVSPGLWPCWAFSPCSTDGGSSGCCPEALLCPENQRGGHGAASFRCVPHDTALPTVSEAEASRRQGQKAGSSV